MEKRYIDIHAHMQFSAYDADRAELLSRTKEQGVSVINVGTDLETSQAAILLAEEDEGLYATVALHPADGEQEFDRAAYEALAEHPKVVAIGECGLDYFHLSEDTARNQRELFIQHIEIANTLGKPLMLHIRSGKEGRSAYKDALDILREHAQVKGNVHFFAGSVEEAKEFIDLGFTISFTGVVTFTHDYDEVIRVVPLEMIMAETDCPFVTPAPYRGKRNEPLYVQEVYKVIARIKNLDEETVRQHILANAQRVFGV
jgi:TatD DNase family protein